MKDEQIRIEFGKRLKMYRKKAGLTQEELAELVGFSNNFIGMIERGKRNTNYTNIFKLVYALNCTMEDFFKGF